MKKQKGVLFDLDGVLLNSEDTYTTFWSEVDRHYPTGVPDFARIIKGCNLHEILTTYFAPEVHDDVTAMLDRFQHDMVYHFFDGAMEFVQQLNDAGIPACVVTSSDRRKMQSLYSQHPSFEQHFEAVVTGEMVQRAKPQPDCFLLGAKLLGLNIKDCYVMEDSINGLKAGKASGAKVIGLATTCDREVVAQYALRVLDNFVGFTVDDMLAL